MDEYIELLDENGMPTGASCLKSVAHKYGYFHATVHIWFYTKNSEILIQKRQASKDTFPNLWDVSVAGHIPFGETPEQGAIREISEEIGLSISKKELIYFGTHSEKHKHNSNKIDHELHHIFFSLLTEPLQNLTIQEEEVAAIKLVSLDELKTMIYNTPHNFVPHSKDYFTTILYELEEHSTSH